MNNLIIAITTLILSQLLYAQNSEFELDFDKSLKTTESFSYEEKIAFYSNLFVGQNYLAGPLGEGIGAEFDADPLYRFDVFDCTTYVETVLALSLTQANKKEFETLINDIRYDTDINFVSRNHFISLDWINDNKNILMDITGTFTVPTNEAKANIQKTQWYKKMTLNQIQGFDISDRDREEKLKRLKEQSNYVDDEFSKIKYIEIKYAIKDEVLNQIPNGSIINIVRPNWNLEKYIGTNLNISHQGFAIRIKDQVFFRHASSNEGKVSDILLKDYLKPYLGHSTIKGINILELY